MSNSLPSMMRASAQRFADRPVIWRREADKQLVAQTYPELCDAMESLAGALIGAGVQPGECVVVLSENRPEWTLADLAILCAGAVTVPLYPSLPAAQVEPLVARVRARFAIVEDARQLAKLLEVRDRLPQLERIWVLDPRKLPADCGAELWDDLVADGVAQRAARQPEIDARVAALTRDDLATIIFTSGTTGVPKGAMLTHGNFLHNIECTRTRITLTPQERMLTILPMSHVFMRMVLYLGYHEGGSTLFNENLRQLLPDLVSFEPTLLIVVPRMLEMLKDRVQTGIRGKEGLAGRIAQWAMAVGEQVAMAYEAGRPEGAWLSLQRQMAESRVFSAIREQLGLKDLRYALSGGAALPVSVSRWFTGLGVTVLQGYGLTETSPVVTCNPCDGRIKFESVGPPLDGVEVTLAPDGELLTRGPSVMRGYFEEPDATAEVIDADGWFHTGDLAVADADGYIQITDRKKNIMVLANGKNVAPVAIENKLVESPLIARALAVGDGQNVVTALLVPDYEALYQALAAAGEAPERDADNAWVECAAATAAVKAEVERLSTTLAPFEQVRRFRLLRQDFSLEREEITPTLKLRRKPILEHYQDLVRAMAD